MHPLAEQSVEIACPVAAVYDYATNLEHLGEWFPGVIGVASADDRAHASVGKTYRETVEVPGRGRVEVGIHVREARPDAWLATEGDLAPLLPRMEMHFAALTPRSCRLTWRIGSRHPGDDQAVRTALWPAASRLLSQRAVEGLARLKQRLEQRAPA